jgi:hypothetical protein
LTSYRRATTDADAPGANDAATISLFGAYGLALEAVRRIDALFELERSINGCSADDRRARSWARRSSPNSRSAFDRRSVSKSGA